MALSFHIRKVHPSVFSGVSAFLCESCPVICRTARSLALHKDKFHGSRETESVVVMEAELLVTEEEEKDLTCPICNEVWTDDDALDKHIREHYADRKVGESVTWM